MRLMLLLSLGILSACGTKAPQPKSIEECVLIALPDLAPYLHCNLAGDTRLIPILKANKYKCISPKDDSYLHTYEKTKLRPYIQKLESKR